MTVLLTSDTVMDNHVVHQPMATPDAEASHDMNLLIDLDHTRCIATAAATMRTLASPTSDPAMPVAVWRTDLPAGSCGPEHTIDADQLVVVLSGAIDVRVGEHHHVVHAGDGIKLPSGVLRVVKAVDDAPAITLTVGGAGALATVAGREPVVVPWTA